MTEVNVVYSDQAEPSHVSYECDIGKVWMSNSPKNNMPNVYMNANSYKSKKHSHDSIFLAEPICVMPKNYNIEFLDQFKYIFTWATKPFKNTKIANKIVYVNFPSYKHNPQIDGNWPGWKERTDEIVFIANNKHSAHPSELYSLRTKLADWFHTNSKLKVSWYGNMPVRKPYYCGNVKNKLDVLRKAKFHVCIENCYDPVYSANFLTEKLPDAWFSGIVPIYMGCSNMNELVINDSCYINMFLFRQNFNELKNKLELFTENDYKQLTENYVQLSDNIYKLTSYQNMFDIIINKYIK